MRNATIHPSGLGFKLILPGVTRQFDTMSRLVDFCNENNINAIFIR